MGCREYHSSLVHILSLDSRDRPPGLTVCLTGPRALPPAPTALLRKVTSDQRSQPSVPLALRCSRLPIPCI